MAKNIAGWFPEALGEFLHYLLLADDFMGRHDMIHRDVVGKVKFSPYQLASVTLRRVRLAAHDRDPAVLGIGNDQPMQPGLERRFLGHPVIVEISILVIADLILGTTSDEVPHIDIPYAFPLEPPFNYSVVELRNPLGIGTGPHIDKEVNVKRLKLSKKLLLSLLTVAYGV